MKNAGRPSLVKRIGRLATALCAILAVSLGLQGGLAQAQTVYFHNDTAGSPVAATDEAGNLLWKESYRPYGERMLKPAAANTQWFHGKQLDPDTGMEDFGARNYDPVLGRFLSIDPVDFQDKNIHSFNRYNYGNNNPLKYKDPDGRNPVLAMILFGLYINDLVNSDVPIPGGALAKGASTVERVAGSAVAKAEAKAMAETAATAEAGAAKQVVENTKATSKIDRAAFAKERSDYWRKEAQANPSKYGAEDLARMEKGKAPTGPDGHPMELHHVDRTMEGGLKEMSRTEHRLGENFKKNHPN